MFSTFLHGFIFPLLWYILPTKFDYFFDNLSKKKHFSARILISLLHFWNWDIILDGILTKICLLDPIDIPWWSNGTLFSEWLLTTKLLLISNLLQIIFWLKSAIIFHLWKLSGPYPEAFSYRYTSLEPKHLQPKNFKNFEKSKVNKFVVCNRKSQQVQNQKRINLTMKFKTLNTLNTTKHHVLWGSFTLT